MARRTVVILSLTLAGAIAAIALLSFASQRTYSAAVATAVLYDASLGGTPDEQHFIYLTHAEGAFFDTTTDLITYELVIEGDTYTLTADGLTLSGPLRDYTTFGNFPYTTPDFIFLGDNTSSAAAEVKLSYVAIAEGVRPEPTPVPVVYLPLIARP